MTKPLLVIDVGGTTIKYAYWADAELTNEQVVPTPRTWTAFEDWLCQLACQQEIRGVSLCLPGAVDVQSGWVTGSSKVDYLFNRPLISLLEEIFNVPIAIENDAYCAALAELTQGAGHDLPLVAFLVLGTGIGGSYAVNGELIKGRNGFAGEFGCMYLSEGDIWSKVASPVVFFERYRKQQGLPASFTGEDFFQRVEEEEEAALIALNQWMDHLGRGVFNLLVSLDPYRLIIGGGISQNTYFIEKLREKVQACFETYPLPEVTFDIQAAHFQQRANLLGAAINYERRYLNA